MNNTERSIKTQYFEVKRKKVTLVLKINILKSKQYIGKQSQHFGHPHVQWLQFNSLPLQILQVHVKTNNLC